MEASATGTDYYAILGVVRTSTHAEISSSYRKLARLKHPDKNPENANATAEFQILQEAYSVLSNADKRREYDRVGPFSFRNSQQPDKRHAKRAFKKTFFAFHVNPSWTGAQNPKPDCTRPFQSSRSGQQQQQKPNPFGPHSNEQQPPKDQRETGNNQSDSSPHSSASPVPAGRHQPTPLEEEMRQKREQIRISEKAIAQLQTKQARLGALLDTTWQQISLLTGSLGRIDEERQKLQKNPGGRDWFEELFGPMPTEAELSSVQDDMDKLSHRHKQLSDAVAGLHQSLEAHTTKSRDLISQIQRENECQTELKRALHQLCRRWRADEFLGTGAGTDVSEEADPLNGLNDWSGWDECDDWCAWDEPLSYEEDKEPTGPKSCSDYTARQGKGAEKGVGMEWPHDGWIDDMYAQDETTACSAHQQNILEAENEKEDTGKEDDDGNDDDSDSGDEDEDEDDEEEDGDDDNDGTTDESEDEEEEDEKPLIDMEWNQFYDTLNIDEVQWQEW